MNGGGLYLVVGLGNPGETYRHTRHNVGFQVVSRLAATAGIRLDCLDTDRRWGRARIAGRSVVLVHPLAYMNRSGPPVRRLMEEMEIDRREMLVVHDDIDLALGRLKIKEKGGDGGHRGIRSLMDALGTGDFCRLRFGIGRPAPGTDAVDHVLGKFTPQETVVIDTTIERACGAVATVLVDGTRAAMNRFNTREP